MKLPSRMDRFSEEVSSTQVSSCVSTPNCYVTLHDSMTGRILVLPRYLLGGQLLAYGVR